MRRSPSASSSELSRPRPEGDRPPCTRPRSSSAAAGISTTAYSSDRSNLSTRSPAPRTSARPDRAVPDVGADLGCQPLQVVHLVARQPKHRGGVGAPSPSPAAIGIRFSISMLSAEGATSRVAAAPRGRAPRDWGPRRRRTAPRRAAHRRSRCGPTGSTHRSASRARAGRRRGAAEVEAQVELRGRSDINRLQATGEADEVSGLSASALESSGRPASRSAARAASRPPGAASSSERASDLRRCANASWTSRRTGSGAADRCGEARSARSRRGAAA